MEGMVVLGWVLPKSRTSNKGFYVDSSLLEVISGSRSGIRKRVKPGRRESQSKGELLNWSQLWATGAQCGQGPSEELCRMYLRRDHLREPKKGVFISHWLKFSLNCQLPSSFVHASEWPVKKVLSVTCTSGCWLLQQWLE